MLSSICIGAHITAAPDASRQVLDCLRRIVQLLRESSRRAEQQLGISGAQLFVLETLAESPHQSLNEVAARTRTHQSSVSIVVARLVERGLVARQRAAGDARRLELALTARGRRLTKASPAAVQHRLVRAIEDLPPRSRRQLATLLCRIATGMDAIDHPPRMFFDDDRRKAPRRNA